MMYFFEILTNFKKILHSDQFYYRYPDKRAKYSWNLKLTFNWDHSNTQSITEDEVGAKGQSSSNLAFGMSKVHYRCTNNNQTILQFSKI